MFCLPYRDISHTDGVLHHDLPPWVAAYPPLAIPKKPPKQQLVIFTFAEGILETQLRCMNVTVLHAKIINGQQVTSTVS